MIRQEDIDLIADTKAFNPDPIRIQAPGWLEAACWIAVVVIFMATAVVIGCPVGWLVR